MENLIRKAPAGWLNSACVALRGFSPTASTKFVLQRLPSTNNADLSFLMTKVARLAADKMSWEALSWAMSTAFATYHRWQDEHHIELLWGGPSPATGIPARRIDQALYDLIADDCRSKAAAFCRRGAPRLKKFPPGRFQPRGHPPQKKQKKKRKQPQAPFADPKKPTDARTRGKSAARRAGNGLNAAWRLFSPLMSLATRG